MRILKKLMAGISALTLCAGMTISGFSGAVQANAVDDNNDDWLHAVGSRLYDKDGNEVWLTGANWFGFNCGENLAHGLYAADCDEFLSSVANHGINIIRMPISTELLVSWMNGKPNEVSSVNAGYSPPTDEVGEDGSITPAGSYVNMNKDFVESDGKTVKNSLEIFDVIMQKMKKYGLKVLIDVHSPTAHNSGHNYNLWYYNSEAEACDTMAIDADGKEVSFQDWIDSITWLAERYANDDTILAYDLKNEPHGKRGYDGTTCPNGIARWDDTELENNWAYAATKCGNSILDVNPNALILIEGVEQYPKTDKGYTYDTADIWQASAEVSPWYGAWWGGNLRGVRDYPIDFGSESRNSQIVYSPHDYGPSVYEQTWFNKDFTTQTLLDDYWYDTWAYINQEDIAPLLIGEWGGHMDGGKNQKWMTLLRDYMIDNHINHTFWCLNPNSGDTGGLLGYDFITWDDEKYDLFEPSLWQTSKTGTYIGLDHQHKLGDSGLTVTEYYNSYASAEGSNLDAGEKTDPITPPTPEPTTEPATQDTTTAPDTSEPDATDKISNMPGDVNCDKTVDILDIIALNKAILGQKKLNQQEFTNADVDKNSKTEPVDSLNIMKYIVKLISDFDNI
ncbi:MAG: cellulase family glycosylhydrolase [Oscillospiraceae bacterium]|nr:cellulase family glycosylhydrolase [Oscillospiraceae bacterium]